jgi:hypothetical protein
MSLFSQQLEVQCSDRKLSISKKDIEMLPGLNIGNDLIKRPRFPRYYKREDEYVPCDWIPPMAYMKQLIDFFIFDYREIRKNAISISFKELYIMAQDYVYLCVNERICDDIVDRLSKLFFFEQRQKKEHWIFILQYFHSKKNNLFFDFTNTERRTRDTMINYWLETLNRYNTKFILCNDENDHELYALNQLDLCKRTATMIQDSYRFCHNEWDAFKRRIKNNILDLSDFELTDDTLYWQPEEKNSNRQIDSGLNDRFFYDVLNVYPVRFDVHRIILDNNNITQLPITTFIKCFPNIQTLSVKGCPINQPLSEDDITIFWYVRSHYLTKILGSTSIFERMYDDDEENTLMWNGRHCLCDGYNYENDTRPLTVITDSFHVQFFNNYITQTYSLRQLIGCKNESFLGREMFYKITILWLMLLLMMEVVEPKLLVANSDGFYFTDPQLIWRVRFVEAYFVWMCMYNILDIRVLYKRSLNTDKLIVRSVDNA